MSRGLGKIQRNILDILSGESKSEWFNESGNEKISDISYEEIIEEVYDKNNREASLYEKQSVYRAVKGLQEKGWLKIIVHTNNRKLMSKLGEIDYRKVPSKQNFVEVEFKDFKIWNPKKKIYYEISV